MFRSEESPSASIHGTPHISELQTTEVSVGTFGTSTPRSSFFVFFFFFFSLFLPPSLHSGMPRAWRAPVASLRSPNHPVLPPRYPLFIHSAVPFHLILNRAAFPQLTLVACFREQGKSLEPPTTYVKPPRYLIENLSVSIPIPVSSYPLFSSSVLFWGASKNPFFGSVDSIEIRTREIRHPNHLTLHPHPHPLGYPQSLFSAFSPRQKRDPPKNRRVTSTLSPTTPDPSFSLESRFFLFLRGHPIAPRISAEIPTQIRSAHNPHRSQFVSPGQAFPLSAANKPQPPPPPTCCRHATLCLSPKKTSFLLPPNHPSTAPAPPPVRYPLWLPTSNNKFLASVVARVTYPPTYHLPYQLNSPTCHLSQSVNLTCLPTSTTRKAPHPLRTRLNTGYLPFRPASFCDNIQATHSKSSSTLIKYRSIGTTLKAVSPPFFLPFTAL
ncbi:uncharacterized protein CLUP02_08615 [Colletotrichum lupini]|uniref:Uncharacterized protein n=1 Tax=Colletotrichum lupini TaxID=145971 RepID=A0A9Q8WHM7_9PEZI|nr:uncharacterized protein CLUP02_08615 [Colletotrichum lupini]UQC83122.1 hypothetical protein CLUP02_08615 [Colletotrichum lupini]